MKLEAGRALGTSSLVNPELHGENWVPGSGLKPCAIAVVGEAPGAEEVKERVPFVGPSGKVNWQLAAMYAGLYRRMCYVTNWCKIPLSSERKKAMLEDEKREWTEALALELEEVQPSLILALGGYAVDALLGPGHSLFWSNGIPFRRGERVIIPIVHPAAGLHKPDMFQLTVDGYKAVRAFLDGQLQPREGWAPQPVTKTWQEWEAVGVDPWSFPLGIFAFDTEGLLPHPLSIQWAIDEQRAVYMEFTDAVGMHRLRAALTSQRPLVVAQNAPHDLAITRFVGLDLRALGLDVEDTMEYAFVDQTHARGLKPMAQKFLNVQMQDYSELVQPWADKATADWEEKAYAAAIPAITLIQQFTPKGKPRLSGGEPVFKREGPEPQFTLVQHIERRQQLHDNEIRWAERAVGERRPGLELRFVPMEERMAYAGRDACVTLGLHPILKQRAIDNGLGAVVELDHATLPMVEEMMAEGLNMNLARYWEVMGEISSRRSEVIQIIQGVVETEFPGHAWTKAAEPFNPGSGDQVAEFCRLMQERENRLKLTRLTKSRERFSVDDNALKMVKDDHPFVPLELEFRELDKLENSYLVPMMPRIRQVGELYKVFFTLKPFTVVSGRYASEDPNVLAWPSRTANGMKLRSIFCAPPGMTLGSWDSSQIEMRIAAAFSRDPVMLEVFLKGLDPHAKLASELFGVSYEECLSGPGKLLYRTPCKSINYGWIYGIGEDKLFEECWAMGVTAFKREDYKRFLKETREVYRGCAAWLAAAGDEARRYGFVSDWMGRRRFLPATQLRGEHWSLRGLRLEAERQAGNLKIQAANSELLKRAMVTVREVVYPKCRAAGIDFRLWLQVHDELLGAVTKDAEAISRVNTWMKEAMTQDSWLLAPLVIEAEGHFGDTWDELK